MSTNNSSLNRDLVSRALDRKNGKTRESAASGGDLVSRALKRKKELETERQSANAEKAGSEIVSRINDWTDNSTNYINNYNRRISSFGGDTFDASSQEWLDTLTAQKSNFDLEADNIRSILGTYGEYYGSEWVNEVNKLLDERAGKRTDLAQRFEECGIRFDTSKATHAQNMFAYFVSLIRVPVLDLTKATQNASMFNNCRNLVTIDKIILPSSEHAKVFSTAFQRCDMLQNIIFEGWICTAMDFSACSKLTHDSLMSIINALQSGVSSLTVTLGTTNLNKLTDTEKAIATEKGWTLA